MLSLQCRKLREWNEAGRRWTEIIGHGDEMLGRIVGERYGGMSEVGETLRGLLDKCLVNERVGLEKDVVSFLPLTSVSPYLLSFFTYLEQC